MSDTVSKKPAVSVVVPVYNVEAYLDRCVESLVTQTLRDIEIILVDDGSTDSSPSLCDAWAKRDARIGAVHKMNGGLSDARNIGVEIAKADLIGFVDSDDWVEPNMYETLYRHIREDGSDIAVCGTRELFPTRVVDPLPPKQYVQTGKEALRDQLIGDIIHVWVPTKLYTRSIVESKPLPVGLTFEDTYIVADWFLQAGLVSVDLEPLYCYWHHDDTISAMCYTKRMAGHLVAARHAYESTMEQAPELEDAAAFRLYWAHFNVLDAMFAKGAQRDDETKAEIISFLRENAQSILANPHVGNGRKLAMRALMVSEGLYRVFSQANARKLGR